MKPSNPTGPITDNFNWEEFHCKCGNCVMPIKVATNIKLLVEGVLQPLRSALGVSVKISSGYRCPAHNRRCGGARHSQHMQGAAADIKIAEIPPFILYKILDLHMRNVNKLGPGGMGKYSTFTHVDIRETTKAVRW